MVDMRWGVKDPDMDDHVFPELCIRELSTCQKISTGPKFVVSLLADVHSFIHDCSDS